jgi:hypothetical protein
MGIAKNRNAFPVLIIDEADIVLGIDSNGEVFDQTKNLLTSFVSNTKHRMNLILVSTDHAYPCRLEREGFNLQNVYNTIFAAEISPKEMWKLLVSATYEEGDNNGKAMIGMGPHLAELCIAAYGGHIWTVKHAIQGLSLRQDEAEASIFLPDLSSRIISCVNAYPMSRSLLKAMAQYGFAPMRTPSDISAAEMLSKYDVGGAITRNNACIGISQTKWNETTSTDAVIPSFQAVRLTIAQVLLRTKEKGLGM